MFLLEARRFLRKSRLLTLSGVLILALGFSASSLTLCLLRALSASTFPGLRHAGYATLAEETGAGGSIRISWQRFADLCISSGRGSTMAAYSNAISVPLQRDRAVVARPVHLAAVSSGFFSTFTEPLIAGQNFSLSEDTIHGNNSIILTDKLATTLYGGSAAALNQTLLLKAHSFRVIGVAPPSFHGLFGQPVDGWVPAHSIGFLGNDLPADPDLAASGLWTQIASFYGIATSHRQSSTALTGFLNHSLLLRRAGEAPLHVSEGLTTDPLRDALLKKQLRLGFVLALGFILLSSLDYALLLVARIPYLLGEVRLKRALGATVFRLILDLLAGPAIMVGFGLALAYLVSVAVLVRLAHEPGFLGQLAIATWGTVGQVFILQLLAACLLTALISLLPSLNLLSDRAMANTIGQSGTGTFARLVLQLPVVAQITFCALTWVLAGMIAASLVHAFRMPLGYQPEDRTVFDLSPGDSELEASISIKDPNRYSFPSGPSIRLLLSYVSSWPGVEAAGLSGAAPFDGEPMNTISVVPAADASAPPRTANNAEITPGFFHTNGTRILRGHDLSIWGKSIGKEVVLNESLARELWGPQRDPVGQRLRLLYPAGAGIPATSELSTVVGVAEDMRLEGATSSAEPTIFRSAYDFQFMLYHSYLLLHTQAGSSPAFEQALDSRVHELIPKIHVTGSWSLKERAWEALRPERQRTLFALTGALLMAMVSGIGLVASLSYWVASRRREIALRIALGASLASVRSSVLARAARAAMAAVLISMPGWLLLRRIAVEGSLGALDWSTGRALAIAVVCFALSVGLALLPAAAAAAIAPAEVLKEQ